jgi:3-deoxy-D-manno-octulosonate 8-phosphate phosphatase (KDO 8-P phosphatase)
MEEKLKDIEIIALDVDGVLTDNKIHIDELGNIRKVFTYKDLVAIERLRPYFKVILITSSDRVNDKLAEYMGLSYHHVRFGGRRDKKAHMFRYLQTRGLNWRNLLFVGDGIVDKTLLQASALAFCPSDAELEIKQLESVYKLKTKGGDGVVSELYYKLLHREVARRRSEHG